MRNKSQNTRSLSNKKVIRLLNYFIFIVQLNLPALSCEVSRDEIHGLSSTGGDSSSGGAASPLTARSMRLERVAQALAHSQEELRR